MHTTRRKNDYHYDLRPTAQLMILSYTNCISNYLNNPSVACLYNVHRNIKPDAIRQCVSFFHSEVKLFV